MKDALMKYETIDAKQIDDLMNRTEVRPPADWDDSKPSGGDKPSGGSPVKEGEIKNDGVDKPSVGKPGDIPSQHLFTLFFVIKKTPVNLAFFITDTVIYKYQRVF